MDPDPNGAQYGRGSETLLFTDYLCCCLYLDCWNTENYLFCPRWSKCDIHKPDMFLSLYLCMIIIITYRKVPLYGDHIFFGLTPTHGGKQTFGI